MRVKSRQEVKINSKNNWKTNKHALNSDCEIAESLENQSPKKTLFETYINNFKQKNTPLWNTQFDKKLNKQFAQKNVIKMFQHEVSHSIHWANPNNILMQVIFD